MTPDQALADQLRPLVDDAWYRDRYPDIGGSGLDPLQHYARHGAAEGRDPNPFFDGEWYLAQNPDVSATGMPPMLHYVTLGAAQLRNPHPRFDAPYYVAQHPQAARNPLVFHLTEGRQRGWPTERPIRIADYLPATRKASHGRPAIDAEAAQFASTLARFRRSRLPCILMVSQPLGGGVRRHVDALVGRLEGVANVLLLDARHWGVTVSVPALPGHADLTIAVTRMEELAEFLAAVPIARAHVHHTMGLDGVLRGLLHRLGVPFDATLHDYYGICPQVNLLPSPDGAYCGEPGPATCNACIARRPSHGARDIVSWRRQHAWVFLEAEHVLCPSADARDRLHRFHPAARTVLAPHELAPPGWATPKPPSLRLGEALRVAVIGVLAPQKGAAAVIALAERADPAALSLHLIGAPEEALPALAARRIRCTGPYAEAALDGLLADANPHVVWFPATWPETYSYTLTAALDAALPIVASRIGAFPERLAGRKLTWLHPPNGSAADSIAIFADVRRALETPAKAGRATARPAVADFYAEPYVRILRPARTTPRPVDLRRPGRLSVVVVPEAFGTGVPTPCGYIRLLQPLDHAAMAGDIDIVVADAATALDYRADVIATQRHAVPDIAAVDRLAAHCRQQRITLLYDLDDDLIDVPPEHPEFAMLRAKAELVAHMIRTADTVWVSTEALRARLARTGRAAVLVPNALDERIWCAQPPPMAPSDGRALRILYMGSATHDADFALVAPALGALVEASRGRIAFDMVGVSAAVDQPAWVNRLGLPPLAGASYPGFVDWMLGHRGWPGHGWDIGIAPLVDSAFNRCKSAIKTMDYAALGLATVASDLAAFRGSLADGAGGMLAANTPAAWHAALALLIKDRRRMQALAEGGRAALMARHSLSAQTTWRRELWLALAPKSRHRPVT